MAERTKILSYGGGLNSFAMLLYSLEQGNPPDWCVFADTGSGNWEEWSPDGEWYGTYRHMVEYAIPICEANGIGFKWITHEDSKVRGQTSLLKYFEHLRVMPDKGPRRYCTEAAKIERIERWMWETFGETPLEVWIGFEAGEENRRDKDEHGNKTCGQSANEPGAVPKSYSSRYKKLNRTKIFPLIGTAMCRCRCETFVRNYEFPVPRKSACWFCPYGKRGDWITLSQQMPEQFERAAALEENQKGSREGRFYTFNTYQRKGKEILSPLWEDIYRPYQPKRQKCPVCGRDPKATKAPGIDFLSPDEYVSAEEPIAPWEVGPWSTGWAEGESATLGQLTVETEPVVLLQPLNLTQQNTLQWLSARMKVPLIAGALPLPLEEQALNEAAARLDWFWEYTQLDRDTNPDSKTAVDALRAQLEAEAKVL